MKFAQQYLQSAAAIIDAYDGSLPLHHFLKSYFAQNKKFGSKDRRHISHLCYSFYRLGKSAHPNSLPDRIATVLYLSGADEWADLFLLWMDITIALTERRQVVQQNIPDFTCTEIFPWQDLSAEIEQEALAYSHLFQPKLFIRLRPGKQDHVKAKLKAANIPFEEPYEQALSFSNQMKVQDVLTINEEYVVQDLSSQTVGEFMKLVNTPQLRVWDCCAASGGKAIMAKDVLQVKSLLVTDVRQSIILNLRKRFAETGISYYSSLVVDVASEAEVSKAIGKQKFDLIICDAPCSGSGTWGRTPEQLYYFNQENIDHYTNLQKKIAANAVNHLTMGGHLLYITCSVFKKENEEVVDYLQKSFGLQVVKQQVIEGYDKGADTMFAALLSK